VRRPVGGWPHRALRTSLNVVIGVVVEARADGSPVPRGLCMSVVSFGAAKITLYDWSCVGVCVTTTVAVNQVAPSASTS
jgi:hypothetical protein